MDERQRTHISQTATAETVLRVSQQQLLDSQLLELGDEELMQRVENELNENSALEEGDDDDNMSDDYESSSDEDYDTMSDDDSFSSSVYDYDDEELPVYVPGAEPRPDIPVGEVRSFVDDLREQIADHETESPKQAELVDYLIGSLNDSGFVDRPLSGISDDLLFNHNIDASVEELERALKVLQQFDPPGIGARDLRECMLIQIDRKINETSTVGNLGRLYVLGLAREVVRSYFSLFKNNELARLAEKLGVEGDVFQDVLDSLHRLNPRPGLSLSEDSDGRSHAIVPDFIIETSLDGDVTVTMRGSRIPSLRVNQSFRDLVATSQGTKAKGARREDLRYVRENVDRAEMFIKAIHRRQDTLYRTMIAIVNAQKPFVLTQDETLLRPLTGGEIAEKVGVDRSTISRAVANRYCLLDGTLYPVKHFLLRTRRNAEGDEVLSTQVENAIRKIVEGEDVRNPLNDNEISELLSELGLNIKRRTVAKYRDQMGIPSAKIRRQF